MKNLSVQKGGGAKRRASEIRKACPGTNCGNKMKLWIVRNIVHFLLVSAAVAAVLVAVLLSLDSCSTETRNITVTTEIPINITVSRNVTVTRNVTRIENVTTTINVTQVTPLASLVAVDGSGSMASNNKWTDALQAIKTLNSAFQRELNDYENSTNDKFYSGLIQWTTRTQSRVESGLSLGNATTDAAVDSINFINGGSTYWGPGLCQAFKELDQNAVSGANKLAILLADGLPSGNDLGSGTCATDGNRGAGSTTCFCDYLWARASALNYVSAGSYQSNTVEFVEEFMKTQNITILSVLVGTADANSIYRAASCDSISFANRASCTYFFQLNNFNELANRATEIASLQKTLATTTNTETQTTTQEETTTETETETVTETQTSTTTTQETTQGSVSVCSLDFLYALIAFGPFLVYLIYRIIDIKAKSSRMRRQLIEMIRKGTLSRSDIGKFAVVAANLLLPKNYSSDIDWIIAYLLYLCPCMRPASKGDLEAVFTQTTIAL